MLMKAAAEPSAEMLERHQPVEILRQLDSLFGLQVAETTQEASVGVKGHT